MTVSTIIIQNRCPGGAFAKGSSSCPFEFVLDFERLSCRATRGRAGPLDDPLLLLNGRRAAGRSSDRRQAADDVKSGDKATASGKQRGS